MTSIERVKKGVMVGGLAHYMRYPLEQPSDNVSGCVAGLTH